MKFLDDRKFRMHKHDSLGEQAGRDQLQVVIADTDPIQAGRIAAWVRARGSEAHMAASVPEALVLLNGVARGSRGICFIAASLPGGGALELVRRVRTTSDWAERPQVVLLTDLPGARALAHAVRVGADDAVTVPCDETDVELHLSLAGARARDRARARAEGPGARPARARGINELLARLCVVRRLQA
jgi:CheY-like chemotaxis protein